MPAWRALPVGSWAGAPPNAPPSMDQPSPSSARLSLVFSCIGHAYVHLFTGLYLTAVLFLERAFDRPYGELISLWTFGAFL